MLSLVTSQFKINQPQKSIDVGERPRPVASLAFQAAEAGDLLPQQRVPVTIDGERFNAK
jgi:hypothetical protein